MVLCEKLGKTLAELEQQTTQEELILWSAFYELRSQEERAVMERAKRGR